MTMQLKHVYPIIHFSIQRCTARDSLYLILQAGMIAWSVLVCCFYKKPEDDNAKDVV